ncbi:lipocalin family protein [Aureibaculum algae]|uniref:Lipocalin family protein n=1 Tax=Aureibaculum algae TaxID=2584122 RepID=A0A5B7TPL2_9FLAO|nr:lipocalin family protein [Aureibaculum algae]QCX38170.1 lipocalin family protein [Aureibaculum algae]
MKTKLKIGIFCLVVISFFGCSNNDNEVNQEKSIIGTWQLVETYQSAGGPGNWSSVDNGYKYTFLDNRTFSSNRFSECTYGTYSIESNVLTLIYGCEGFTTGIENSAGVFIEKINFESKYLFINPTYIFCVEGCAYKFKKINSAP